MKTIAIIGFGFCGKMAFVNLVKKIDSNSKIIIFDKAQNGLFNPAFADFSPNYILNVPAKKMSAFCGAEKEDDFCNFLKKYYPDIYLTIGDYGFAPRYIYGQYLNQILNNSITEAENKQIEFFFINQEVTNIAAEHNHFLLATQNDELFQADEILMANSLAQTHLPLLVKEKNFINNLWHRDALDLHRGKLHNGTICLIGSSLSAIDIILNLKYSGFQGRIIAISRHGNLPKEFIKTDLEPVINADEARYGILFICRKIREFLRFNSEYDLRHVVASLRSTTPALWNNLDDRNKKLFLRLMPYWNIFRHLLPEQSLKIVKEMIKVGQLSVNKGGIKNIKTFGDKFFIQTKYNLFETDYLVNCLGFEFDPNKYVLFVNMMGRELLKKDVLMVKSNHPKIHLLGSLNIGKYFECTAVPELRVNVEDVVKRVASTNN